MKNHVHILKMGGTIEFIDPTYDVINREMLKLDTSIESYLTNMIKPHFNYSYEYVCSKDSRDITQEDREKLTAMIQDTPHDRILVTHGTFTMAETAVYLQSKDTSNKVIILTGSMIPLVGFSASDAGFNLGFACAGFDYLQPGVYLAMNGKTFKPTEVAKNTDSLRFE